LPNADTRSKTAWGTDVNAMTDEDREIIDTIERWAERELRPIARKFDHADEYPTEIVAQMKELGLFGATIPPSTAASVSARAPTHRSS